MGCVGGLWVLRFRRDPDDVEEVSWGYNNTLSHLPTLTGVHSTTSRPRGQSFMVSYYVFHNDEVDVKRRQKDIPYLLWLLLQWRWIQPTDSMPLSDYYTWHRSQPGKWIHSVMEYPL